MFSLAMPINLPALLVPIYNIPLTNKLKFVNANANLQMPTRKISVPLKKGQIMSQFAILPMQIRKLCTSVPLTFCTANSNNVSGTDIAKFGMGNWYLNCQLFVEQKIEQICMPIGRFSFSGIGGPWYLPLPTYFYLPL